MVRDLTALGEGLSQHRAADDQTIVSAVRAGAIRGHAIATVTPEPPVDLQRLELERALRHLIEDLLRIERAVIVAHTRMIAADQQMAAAVVLTKDGVQQGLAGPAVANLHRVPGLNARVLDEVAVDQRV